MSLIEKNLRTWYVGFSVGRDLPWIHKKFTKKEWSHCYCFAQAGPYVMVINPAWSNFEVGLRHDGKGGGYNAVDFAAKLTQDGHTVLRLSHVPEKLSFGSVWMPSCVSLVKVIIGYKTKWTCLNPESLFYDMRSRGAKVVGE